MKKILMSITIALALITGCSKTKYIQPTYPTLNTLELDWYIPKEINVTYEIYYDEVNSTLLKIYKKGEYDQIH